MTAIITCQPATTSFVKERSPHVDYVLSAGGLVFRKERDRAYVLLVGSGEPSKWYIPKGMCEAGESLREAAVREVREETGVDARIGQFLDSAEWTYEYHGQACHELCAFFSFEPLSDSFGVHDDEFDRVEWFPLGQAERILHYPKEQAIAARLSEMLFPLDSGKFKKGQVNSRSLVPKAIILAGGRGERLKPITDLLPKPLLPIGESSLMQRQLDVFRRFDISEVVVLKHYLENLIDIPGLRYHIDPEPLGPLSALFSAVDELHGEVIITYGDIIFEDRVLGAVLNSPGDIVIAVDTAWERYYTMRYKEPLNHTVSLRLSNDGTLAEIGRPFPAPENVEAKFFGLLKLSSQGCAIVRETYAKARKQFAGRQWQFSARFELGTMTDLLQQLIINNVHITVVQVHGGWLEIDTPADFDLARRLLGVDVSHS